MASFADLKRFNFKKKWKNYRRLLSNNIYDIITRNYRGNVICRKFKNDIEKEIAGKWIRYPLFSTLGKKELKSKSLPNRVKNHTRPASIGNRSRFVRLSFSYDSSRHSRIPSRSSRFILSRASRAIYKRQQGAGSTRGFPRTDSRANLFGALSSVCFLVSSLPISPSRAGYSRMDPAHQPVQTQGPLLSSDPFARARTERLSP